MNVNAPFSIRLYSIMIQSVHMQFSSWNVNGLRAVEKKGHFPDYVASGEYDVVFLMETKSELSQLSDAVLHIPAYSFTLQPSTYKKGYAGVGMYVRDYLSPVVEIGFSHNSTLHDEERVMTTTFVHPRHGRIAITGAYFPNGARGSDKRGSKLLPLLEGGWEGSVESSLENYEQDRDNDTQPPLTALYGDYGAGASRGTPPIRRGIRTSSDFPSNLEYKLAFFQEFLKHMQNLETHHDHVLVCGDINIAHNPIDLARPQSNQKTIGFLPIERAELDNWTRAGWIDIYRHMNPDSATYSYWDVISRARERNVGWRIDSWWCKSESLAIIKSVSYETDQQGSDHCPVILSLL
jgi:exonuclease III